MGWFAIACILGFGLLWGWRLVRPGSTGAQLGVGVASLGALMVALCLWAIYVERASSFSLVIDRIGDGSVARFLLGMVLGFGAGYLVAGPLSGAAPAGNAQGWRARGADTSEGIGKAVILPVGVALTALALTAPYLDRWFAHLSGVKSSFIEIQLANISKTHSDLAPDTREVFIDQNMITSLSHHGNIIAGDVAYLQYFLIPDLQYRMKDNPPDSAAIQKELDARIAQLDQLAKLSDAFKKIVSPIASCLATAVGNGLDIESARAQLRPLTDMIEQIVIMEDAGIDRPGATQDERDRISGLRRDFWTSVILLPKSIKNFLGAEQSSCLAITEKFAPGGSIAPGINLPHYSEYGDLPQLYGAMSYLLLFVHNEDLALQILRKGEANGKFEEFSVPMNQAQIMFFTNVPARTYLPLLNKVRGIAQRRLEVIDRVSRRCGATGCDSDVQEWAKKLILKANDADITAVDLAAYGIAEDLAEGLDSAKPLEAIAENYAEILSMAAKDPGNSEEADGYLDTAAFVHLVVEARKADPDLSRIKEAEVILDGVVSRLNLDLEHTEVTDDNYRLLTLAARAARAHLRSAQSLLGE